PLAHIVVGLADQLEADALGEEGAEALPRRALKADGDGIVGEPLMAVALGDLAGEHGAGGAVAVGDAGLDLDRLAALEGRHGLGDQSAVEYVLDLVVLA